MWQPPDGLAASPPRDSVRKVLLSFYNGELFRIAVSYEWERTEGLTVEDMIAALSSTYGPPTAPDSDIIPLLSRSSVGSDKIVAHWEDSQYSVNLIRPSYASTFGLVMLSKRLDALVRAAMVEAIWLDDQAGFRTSHRTQEEPRGRGPYQARAGQDTKQSDLSTLTLGATASSAVSGPSADET